jgi:hypothetical protein
MASCMEARLYLRGRPARYESKTDAKGDANATLGDERPRFSAFAAPISSSVFAAESRVR